MNNATKTARKTCPVCDCRFTAHDGTEVFCTEDCADEHTAMQHRLSGRAADEERAAEYFELLQGRGW